MIGVGVCLVIAGFRGVAIGVVIVVVIRIGVVIEFGIAIGVGVGLVVAGVQGVAVGLVIGVVIRIGVVIGFGIAIGVWGRAGRSWGAGEVERAVVIEAVTGAGVIVAGRAGAREL